MKIGMIGAGYVGLVSAVCFADFGHKVVCIDTDRNKIDLLKLGRIPIYEPGLENLLKKNQSAGRIIFETEIDSQVPSFDLIFISIGTPTREEDAMPQMDTIYDFCKKIKPHLRENQTVVIKSTVTPGTNKKIHEIFNKENKKSIKVVSNPEFLREGSAIHDFMKPDRVIVGSRDEKTNKLMMEAYKSLFLRDFPIVFTDPFSAEIIKYASNAFLATKISFINEMAALCEVVGGDIKEVAKGMGLDGRIGNKFLHAGPGYGGSCLPKDVLAITAFAKKNATPLKILDAVMDVNNKVKLKMIEKIRLILDKNIGNKIICFLGIAFKPNTDDIRESPSLTIIPPLIREGAEIRAYDPKVKNINNPLLSNVSWMGSVTEGVLGADLVVILTEWNEFRALNLQEVAVNMRSPNLADLRNIFSESEALSAGFHKYTCIGR